jgi:multiple sugar transport system substrate-binding protein
VTLSAESEVLGREASEQTEIRVDERRESEMRMTKLNRRRVVVLLLAGFAVVACVTSALAGTAKRTSVNLTMDVWSYSIPTIKDNIKKFETQNANFAVSVRDTSWFDYHDVMATRFTGGNAPDVAYSSDHWLREWVAAGWIAPLDNHFAQFKSYQKEWAPYALEGMTLDGKLYGLPYYADLVTFIYNERILRQAGFKGAPKTWEEVAKQALAIKQKGLAKYPINIPLKKDDPWLIEIFYSMVYGQGGHMFDKDDNPVFNRPGGPAEKTLQWLRDAMKKWKIFNPAALQSAEPDIVKTMGAGNSVFTVLAKYNLAELNLGQHKERSHFRMALMPGATHSTVGFVRFYAMSNNATKRGDDVVKGVGAFLQFFGGKTNGKYKVVKRWAIEKGLGFANLPLYGDRQVAASINKWGNVKLERSQAKLAHVKEGLTPYWGVWDIYARQQLDAAILGQMTPRKALQSMADRWVQLKKQYGG